MIDLSTFAKYDEGGLKNPLDHPASAQIIIEDKENAIVKCIPQRKKVAIVGFADSTRMKAPFDDPKWEIWGLNQIYRFIFRFDRHFEIHHDWLYDQVRDTNYQQWLAECPRPVYMIQHHQEISNSVRFPIERAIEITGRDYFQSTISYEIALAILEGFEEIGIWGVDLIVGQEYEYQKANCEYWLAIAESQGIKVTIPKESALLKQQYRYGYQPEQNLGGFNLSDFDRRLTVMKQKKAEWEGQIVELQKSLDQIEGAIHECDEWRHYLECLQRGGSLPWRT